MYEINVTEAEAEKPEVQLEVIVYFHSEVDIDAPFLAGANSGLRTREEKIRSIIQDALAEDEFVGQWAYPEVRLAKRTVARGFGLPPVTIGTR